ncbi:oligogalacturonate lyase family protein [Massilia sp. TS11]|uniref:oligogalacturonate lyase family protein n=1 Tax=Massilia sp. TS11 TaxID=2908003 RepID=UPI001EDA8B8B|nr:oligogalacturonate lyase family protein [Massilia sp. TS11]MCG2583941.1 oligogalacturonate lyase family protein [Massilia sp. TS11]
MRRLMIGASLLLATLAAHAQQVLETGSLKPMPKVWIDKDTGHRIKRLEGRQGQISNWYFHNNPFFAPLKDEGDRMLFSESDGKARQVYTLNLKDDSIVQLTEGEENKRLLPMTSQNTREAIYMAGQSLYAVNVDTKKSRKLYTFPDNVRPNVATINADASMVAGSFADPQQGEILRQYPKKADFFPRIFDAHLKNSLFTVDLRTGEYKVIHEENTWLGHVQFSPTDPDVLMFCHEGPWDKVDRIWNINVKNGKVTLMHKRSMPMEIAGHEFFQPDGKVIWFDLQKPRAQTFYLAGADVASGAPVAAYQMTADDWSIHFAISPDKTMFAGDGGDPTQVARAKDGMWIYAFRPVNERFQSERLVNMKAHDYRGLEPNVHFTPDGKWIVFGGTFEGRHATYAVEIAPAAKP